MSPLSCFIHSSETEISLLASYPPLYQLRQYETSCARWSDVLIKRSLINLYKDRFSGPDYDMIASCDVMPHR